MMFLPFALKGLLIAAGVFASWSDAFHRRIPNWLCAVTAVAGLLIGFLSGGWTALGGQLLHAMVALVIGMLLFRFGLFGGGDAKFYAAVAACFTPAEAAPLLLAVALSGLLLVIIWFVYRRVMRKPIRRSSTNPSDSLPYGIAIGMGAIAARFILV